MTLKSDPERHRSILLPWGMDFVQFHFFLDNLHTQSYHELIRRVDVMLERLQVQNILVKTVASICGFDHSRKSTLKPDGATSEILIIIVVKYGTL